MTGRESNKKREEERERRGEEEKEKAREREKGIKTERENKREEVAIEKIERTIEERKRKRGGKANTIY